MKKLLYPIALIVLLSSCAAKKNLASLQEEHEMVKKDLKNTTAELSDCINQKDKAKDKVTDLEEEVAYLKSVNFKLLENTGDLATLSAKEAENLERSLESIREKDLQIKTMRDAINKKDSVTLALVTSLKSSLGDINDPDIEVNVEKGVVFISISDKLLFKSGSFDVSQEARAVLAKVAKVVNDKPDMEFLVEGHTDDVPVSKAGIIDNWDLSVKRATAVVRVLQNEFSVAPEQMTAAGKSYYAPIADNDTPANRSKNRRTRIVVLPKIDQFYKMIEDGMDAAE